MAGVHCRMAGRIAGSFGQAANGGATDNDGARIPGDALETRRCAMSFPLWMLLGFAVWTAAVLICTIGVYRLSRVFSGRAGMASFPADAPEGAVWYLRAMRAHANCIENLPIFAVVVFGLYASGISTQATDAMAGAVLVARIVQSVVHISTVQTDRVVSVRFTFFFVQLLCFLGIAAVVIVHAW
jgi:uncharacterized MAPEG superfamily protein